MKMFAGHPGTDRADTPRIVYYVYEPREKSFMEAVGAIEPVLNILDIDGVSDRAEEVGDVTIPRYNASVLTDDTKGARSIPNLFMSFGNRNDKLEMEKRDILRKVSDPECNFAVLKNQDLRSVKGRIGKIGFSNRGRK